MTSKDYPTLITQFTTRLNLAQRKLNADIAAFECKLETRGEAWSAKRRAAQHAKYAARQKAIDLARARVNK